MNTPQFNGQAAQDYFVRKVLNDKRDGTFLEIGSRDPIVINNTYPLEKELGWRGILVEYDLKYEPLYRLHRPRSIPLMKDATTIDYRRELEAANFPGQIDYLQIDLESSNRSTLTVLEMIEQSCMSDYTFATITFEHDIYTGNHYNTRSRSRCILDTYGYDRVFTDVCHKGMAFEDWYVHPSCVDMKRFDEIRQEGPVEYTEIVKLLSRL